MGNDGWVDSSKSQVSCAQIGANRWLSLGQ